MAALTSSLVILAKAAKEGLARWPRFQIAAVIISAFFLLAVIELIRRNRLKEKYSILWLFSALFLLVFASWRRLLHWTAWVLQVKYPPSLIFVAAFLFLLLIVFHYSTVISKETERSRTMAQKIGLLEHKIEELQEEIGEREEEKKK